MTAAVERECRKVNTRGDAQGKESGGKIVRERSCGLFLHLLNFIYRNACGRLCGMGSAADNGSSRGVGRGKEREKG